MKRGKIVAAVAGVVLAGGIVAGGAGWVSAQTPPDPGTHGMDMQGGGSEAMGAQHTQMQDALAKALGLTTEQLQAELKAGNTVPQIAQEKGLSLTALQSTMQSQHPGGMGGEGMGTHGPMAGGHEGMMGQ
jgi:hypothetical protein